MLHNRKINNDLWDRLMKQSPQSSVFHYRWFLELIDDDWSALVGQDYQWVMPYFSSKKRMLKSSLVPYLGIVSDQYITESEFVKILSFCNKNFIEINYSLSKYHQKYQNNERFALKTYQQKDLIKEYNSLKSTFSTKVERFLSISNDKKLSCISLRSALKFTDFLRSNSHYSESEILVVRKIIDQSSNYKNGKMYAIYNRTNELCAIAFILFSKTKAYNMISCFTREALQQKADYKIINTIIEDLSMYNITFENHSSSIKKDVFEAFGFNDYYYFEYRSNKKQNLLSLVLQYLKL